MGQGSGLVQQLLWGFGEDHLLLPVVTGLFGRHQNGLLTVGRGLRIVNSNYWGRHFQLLFAETHDGASTLLLPCNIIEKKQYEQMQSIRISMYMFCIL